MARPYQKFVDIAAALCKSSLVLACVLYSSSFAWRAVNDSRLFIAEF